MIGKRMEGRAPDITDGKQFLREGSRVPLSDRHRTLPAALLCEFPLGADVSGGSAAAVTLKYLAVV